MPFRQNIMASPFPAAAASSRGRALPAAPDHAQCPTTSAPRTRDARQGLRKTRPTSSTPRRRHAAQKRRAAVETNRRGLPSDGSARNQVYRHSSVAFFILPIGGLDPCPVLEPCK